MNKNTQQSFQARLATPYALLLTIFLVLPQTASSRESLTNLRSDVDQNTTETSTNAVGILSNTEDISTNIGDISTNIDAICQLALAADICSDLSVCNVPSSCNQTAFMTSTGYTGDLITEAQNAFDDCDSVTTGVEGADCICQASAEAAGLSGTYLAWIGDSDAANEPASRFTQSSLPYRMVNGSKIANDWSDLIDGNLRTALKISETGSTASPAASWTAVKADGTKGGKNCSDWSASSSESGLFGERAFKDNDWTDRGSTGCSGTLSLYCFEQ